MLKPIMLSNSNFKTVLLCWQLVVSCLLSADAFSLLSGKASTTTPTVFPPGPFAAPLLGPLAAGAGTGNGGDFGSMFINAIMNGTRTAVERYLQTVADGSSLCSHLTLRLDNRVVANFSTLQVLMIDNQRVQMKIRSAPGFCRMRIIVTGSPLPAVRISLPRPQYYGSTPSGEYFTDYNTWEPQPFSPEKPPAFTAPPFLVQESPSTGFSPGPTVILFNLTANENNLEFQCELVGDFLGYSNVLIQLQQNATAWHDMYKFRISIARAQPVLHFIMQQSAIVILFVANFAMGLQTDFKLFRSALKKTTAAVFFAIVAKLVIMPIICWLLFKYYSFEPDLSTVGLFAVTFSPCGLEAVIHCLLLLNPGPPPEPLDAAPIRGQPPKGHHNHREATPAELSFATGIATAVSTTTMLVLGSLGWLPLGVYSGRLVGLPASLVQDVGDKFLFFESAPPGFEILPYAALAISLGCLLLPFSVGAVIRNRWRRAASRLHNWLYSLVFLALLYIWASSTFSNLSHVLQYISLSTIVGSLVITYATAVITAVLALCCQLQWSAIVAMAIVVACPNVTIALHLIQANLEPPATDLSAILPTIASAILQLPLFMIALIRASYMAYDRHKRNLAKTSSNKTPSGATSNEEMPSPTPSPFNSLHSSGLNCELRDSGTDSHSSGSESSDESVGPHPTNKQLKQQQQKRRIIPSVSDEPLRSNSPSRKQLYANIPASKSRSSYRFENEYEDGDDYAQDTEVERIREDRRFNRGHARRGQRSISDSELDEEDLLPARNQRNLFRNNQSVGKGTLNRQIKQNSKGLGKNKRMVSASSDDDLVGQPKSPAVVRFHPLFSVTTSSRQQKMTMMMSPEVEDVVDGFVEHPTPYRSASKLTSFQPPPKMTSSQAQQQSRCVHFNERHDQMSNKGINVDNITDWSKFMTKTSVIPSSTSQPLILPVTVNGTMMTTSLSSNGGTSKKSKSKRRGNDITGSPLVPVVLETVV